MEPGYLSDKKMEVIYGQKKRTLLMEILNILKRSNENIVALDSGVSNSTTASDFLKVNPNSYFEMYIAEQNMVSVAVGFASAGKIPFVSTFGAFFTRAYDQIRMASQSNSNIKH